MDFFKEELHPRFIIFILFFAFYLYHKTHIYPPSKSRTAFCKTLLHLSTAVPIMPWSLCDVKLNGDYPSITGISKEYFTSRPVNSIKESVLLNDHITANDNDISEPCRTPSPGMWHAWWRGPIWFWNLECTLKLPYIEQSNLYSMCAIIFRVPKLCNLRAY